MSESKHTPGPWKVLIDDCGPLPGRPGIFPVNEDLDCCIVDWDGFFRQYWSSARSHKEMHANARLIAKAPEMFKVCQTLVNIPHIEEAATGELKAALDLAKAVVSEIQGSAQ